MKASAWVVLRSANVRAAFFVERRARMDRSTGARRAGAA
jgi:hypothetical protein